MKLRAIFVLILPIWATLLSSRPALAQFAQQGPKLVGTGAAVTPAQQAKSVSVSADGNTAILGGPGDNSDAGAAWVWTRSGGVWTQQGPKLVGSGALGTFVRQGQSVSLSGDGNTAIVGGPSDNFGVGAAWVWTRSAGVWTQQGTKLVGSGGSGDQGASVALSADGNTAAVGSPGNGFFVWTRTGGVWTQQGPNLVGSGSSGNAFQGSSVSLSADGNTAIVGGAADNSSFGAAWVWTRSGGVWTQQGPKLVGSGAVGSADQGSSVSLSANGNTAIVGGDGDNSSVGATWVWTRSGGVWTQQGPKLVGSGIVGSFPILQGSSVSLSADGNTALVGGFGDNSDAGATWVWTRSGAVWTQQSKLIGSGAGGNPFGGAGQGEAVSLSADGKTAVEAGEQDNTFVGAAWVFVMAPSDLSITKSVTGGPRFFGGGNVGYTISVVNNGPGIASSVVVTDVLPAGTSFVSATPSQGSCSGTTTVACAVGSLTNGGSATISLVLTAAPTPGPVTNTATASATQADPDPANNSSTSMVTTIDSTLAPATSGWILIALAGMLAMLGAMRMRA